MEDIHTYQIEVRGKVDENDLNVVSPLKMAVVRVHTASMLFAVCTDQSGLIGLLRHLHARGLIFLSVQRER